MLLIKNNPYRTIGLLVGATAKEQSKQINKLKKFIEAEQEPHDDFSFPVLGKLNRTVDNISDAANKLNLDKDKIAAAIFWFYKGSHTDEPAFDSLKETNPQISTDIWQKLTASGEVTHRNSSAFQNLSSFLLNEAVIFSSINDNFLEKGIILKLKFLESDFAKEFNALATDETFKISKKDLQLLFLNMLQNELDMTGGITSSRFIAIVAKQEFSAKEAFIKSFVQKPIEQIEKEIEATKKKQKANKDKAGDFGNKLFIATKNDLDQIKSILDITDIKLISVSDKLANEILQCGITLFNHFHETEIEIAEIALDLNKKAKSIALGSVVKERINESTPIVEKYLKNKPERERMQKIKGEFEFISDILDQFESLSESVNNANNLVVNCKPKLIKIKSALGAADDLYLSLSSSIVQNAQNMLVSAINKEVEKSSNNVLAKYGLSVTSYLENIIKLALDTTFNIGSFDMYPTLRSHYNENLKGIKSLANQINISTLSPKEKLQHDLKRAEAKLNEIENEIFYESEIDVLKDELDKIKEWCFLRSKSDRDIQIAQQQKKINSLLTKSEHTKLAEVKNQQNLIKTLKLNLKQIPY